jgi:predicted RNA-binding Zn-ribbon protein involved in translation (DUF1610 family)
MAVMTCQCGARVRVPDDSAAAFRCPKCRSLLATPVGAGAAVSPLDDGGYSDVGGGGAGTGAVCPICQTPIAAHEASLKCPECGESHHRECWDEIGGCAIYGCKAAPQVEKQPDNQPVMSAWGDTKSCPMCGEQIKAIALKCRYCGVNFETVDPLSAEDLRRRVEREKSSKSVRTSVIVLFIFSAIGVLAPLMLLISLIWVLMNKEKLKAGGPVLLVLGYASIGLSAVYSLLMLIFGLSGT